MSPLLFTALVFEQLFLQTRATYFLHKSLSDVGCFFLKARFVKATTLVNRRMIIPKYLYSDKKL